jgi:hypothetical protein
MWLFEKKKLKPKIVLKIYYAHLWSGGRHVRTDISCSGSNIVQATFEISGRIHLKQPRNKSRWNRFPRKSTATICLRISKTKIVTDEIHYFDLWNVKKPKFVGNICLFNNKIRYNTKHTKLKARLERWT